MYLHCIQVVCLWFLGISCNKLKMGLISMGCIKLNFEKFPMGNG